MQIAVMLQRTNSISLTFEAQSISGLYLIQRIRPTLRTHIVHTTGLSLPATSRNGSSGVGALIGT